MTKMENVVKPPVSYSRKRVSRVPVERNGLRLMNIRQIFYWEVSTTTPKFGFFWTKPGLIYILLKDMTIRLLTLNVQFLCLAIAA